MPLTDSEQQTLIAKSLGMSGDSDFLSFMALTWQSFGDMSTIDPRLQPLFVKRAMVDYLIGQNWQRVNWRAQSGTRQDDSDRMKNLENMRDDLTEQIRDIQRAIPPVIGNLINVEPITPGDIVISTIPPDPNAREYKGDPLRRS